MCQFLYSHQWKGVGGVESGVIKNLELFKECDSFILNANGRSIEVSLQNLKLREQFFCF